MRRPHLSLAFVFADLAYLFAGLCGSLVAESRCVRTSSEHLAYGESIALRPVTVALAGTVDAAIELWSDCRRHSEGVPSLLAGTVGTRQIEVVFVTGPSGSRRCGFFQGSTVTLYRSALDADGKPVHCGDIARALAHEIGHVLGLADQYDPACRRYIMSQTPPRETDRRYPTPEECQAVADRWRPVPPVAPS